MHDDPPTRILPERTGRHYCVVCLGAIGAEEYFRNDHICDVCAAKDAYPARSRPDPAADEKPAKKKR